LNTPTGLTGALQRLGPLLERIDRLSLRERALLFGAGTALISVAWQVLLMDPLTQRAHAAEQRLEDARSHIDATDRASSAAARDPAVAAVARNLALQRRGEQIETQLAQAAHDYVSPDRVAEMLREMLASQQGLTLVSLRNLPVESLSGPTAPGAPASADRGPFVHPVELIVDGDYLSVVAYLETLEHLPWRMHWQRLELVSATYPVNRVRIVIGALSLSRDWMRV
jgi:MSHA biogenesis protein MshJ